MTTARIAAINLECADPATLATFWAALLDGEVVVDTQDFCAAKIDSMYVGAVRVDGYLPPTWPARDRPQQLHLDLAVDDLEAAASKAISLGATAEQHQSSSDRSRVMRDPAGHPFCLRA